MTAMTHYNITVVVELEVAETLHRVRLIVSVSPDHLVLSLTRAEKCVIWWLCSVYQSGRVCQRWTGRMWADTRTWTELSSRPGNKETGFPNFQVVVPDCMLKYIWISEKSNKDSFSLLSSLWKQLDEDFYLVSCCLCCYFWAFERVWPHASILGRDSVYKFGCQLGTKLDKLLSIQFK